MNTLSRLQEIFREVFDDDTLVLTRETTAEDVEGWDSIAQVNIIVVCESEFGVKFELNDIRNLDNVGSLADALERKREY